MKKTILVILFILVAIYLPIVPCNYTETENQLKLVPYVTYEQIKVPSVHYELRYEPVDDGGLARYKATHYSTAKENLAALEAVQPEVYKHRQVAVPCYRIVNRETVRYRTVLTEVQRERTEHLSLLRFLFMSTGF